MFCYHCGKEIEDDNIFCPFCGKRIKEPDDNEIIVSSSAKEDEPISEPVGKALGKKDNKIGIIIIILIAAAAIAVAAFLFFGKGNDSKEPASQKTETATEPETSEMSNEIPAGATEYNGNYYELVNDGMCWRDAKEECEEKGGHLAIITSQDEESFIENLIEKNRASNIYHFWLGASDEGEEGVWKWLDGKVFWRGGPAAQGGQSVDGMYQKWLPSQPNNSVKENQEGQDYLEIQVTRGNEGPDEYLTWTDITNNGVAYGHEGADDYNDTHYYGYICEWEGDEL